MKYTLFSDLYTILYTVRGDPDVRLSMRLFSGKCSKYPRIGQNPATFGVTVPHWLKKAADFLSGNVSYSAHNIFESALLC